MKLKSLLSQYSPVMLYTYDTASCRARILEMEDCYDVVSELVERHFGPGSMDNKITIVFEVNKTWSDRLCDLVYLTYWDGNVSIGLDVYFFEDVTLLHNQYRIKKPNSKAFALRY